jgi:predicted secreted hydrolase
VAWDWFSIQFEESNSELMLYKLYHLENGDKLYGGTYTDSSGKSTFLEADQIKIAEVENWRSPRSDAKYPTKWEIEIADLALKTELEALMPDQELELKFGPLTKFYYWEGMAKASGTIGQQQVSGKSYVEMTNRFRVKD